MHCTHMPPYTPLTCYAAVCAADCPSRTALLQIKKDTWYPDARDCKCCKGFVFGCTTTACEARGECNCKNPDAAVAAAAKAGSAADKAGDIAPAGDSAAVDEAAEKLAKAEL